MTTSVIEGLRKVFRKKPQGILDEVLSYQPYVRGGGLPSGLWETPGLDVYRKMRLDGQVGAALSVIKLPLLSRSFTVTSPDEGLAAFVRDVLTPVFRGLMRGTLLAVDYGFAVLEKVWKYDDRGRLVYRFFKDPDPSSLEILVDEFGSFAGVRQFGGGEVAPDKCFLYTHRLEHGNYYGVSRLRPAYPYWRTREIIYLFLNRYLERKGNPPVVVKFPPQTAAAEESVDVQGQAALTLGRKMLENATVALPHVHDERGHDLWDVSYLEDSPRAGMFLDYIEHLNNMILRSMFVPEKLVTNEAPVGSFAMAKVHADIFLMSEEGLLAEIEEYLNRFIVKPLVEFNAGAGGAAQIRLERFEPENRELLREVFLDVVKRGEARPAAELLARELGVPLAAAAPDA